MPLMPQMPVHGHGAVDLAAVKALQQQRDQLEAAREEVTNQLLTQVGLRCQCGNRIRGEAVIYFSVLEGPVATPQGQQLGFNLAATTCCSRSCVQAILLEEQAIARRDGLAGRITWLDEKRAARARAAGEN